MKRKCRICSFDYSTSPEGYDELAAADGSPRPAAAELLRRLESFGAEEFAGRRSRIRNILNENDLNSFSRDRYRHEGVDPLPMVISSEEWRFLEAGVAQRARLFDRLAADMYGTQMLWKNGVLPPALLFANPDFLPVVWQVKVPHGLRVHLLGCDVVRGSDGRFYAAGDKLQVPEGLGRALENRLAVGRAFPELFRELRVERLAGFFKKLLDCLTALQPEGNPDGRTVLLASGPESSRRSEDAVLARYLGLQLVENDDLAVRGLHVHLKTLAGLRPIGTILRRANDGMCDPLELRIDSGEGAVGIISAVRAGNVSMANSLGVGALETPLFKPFLPLVCRELLGEDLLLPDVPSVWLGDAAMSEEVMNEPEKWSFRQVFRDSAPRHFASLTATGQLALLNAIGENPGNWIAESETGRSSVPAWQEDSWRPAGLSMRLFAVNAPDGGMVMPGGFGTFSTEGVQGAPGRCGEKDIWVLADHPVEHFSLLAPADQPVTPTRAGGDLPSRVAENLFRLGRAVESAEMTARLARGLALRLADQVWTDMPELPGLFLAGGEMRYAQFAGDPESALRSIVLRKDNPDGLQSALAEIRELAIQLRDRVSEDIWLGLCNCGEEEKPEGGEAAVMLPYLGRILKDCAVFSGLAAETMTRGHGWRFLEIGRRIERALRTLNLLRHTLVPAQVEERADAQLLQAVLEIGDCSMTYHRRYGGRLQAPPVIDLFLCDETNPRSLAWQAARLRYEVKLLPNASGEAMLSPLDRELLRLLTGLRLADVQELAVAVTGRRRALELRIDADAAALERTAELLTRLYLNHAPGQEGEYAMATEV